MICVDARVAAKWVLPEEYTEQALALYAATVQAREPVVAPLLLPFEVTNIIRQRMLRTNLSLTDADQILTLFFTFPVTLQTAENLSYRALHLADRYGLPATYDAHYVALAELLGCELWTDDRRLLRLLNGALPFVQWIGEYLETAPR